MNESVFGAAVVLVSLLGVAGAAVAGARLAWSRQLVWVKASRRRPDQRRRR